MEITHEELADILYTVSNRLSRLPWDTGVESALREVANEIASRAEPNAGS